MRVYVHDSEGKRVIEADEDSSLVEAAGIDGGDARIWIEDTDEPVAVDAKVGVLSDRAVAAIHVGKGQITVSVTYNGQTRSDAFGPGTKIDKVLDWAVGSHGFDIPVGDQDDLVLREHGSPEDLDPDTHIGTLAGKGDTLALDLVPGERFAG
ncbi:hypothetical protein EV651_110252 [Kribbella sp. VKM Ac-2571]|uniref:hypothetical protein n=1 Tax=Kribbella sp. VKM Ac-2571 TaxID=2512222 RepID=UPI00105C4650|nr:hypothetical protein [Kribbella sp. VKM Ac-2571]TDO58216.1 hypothetical protein EV651_110252 [Kribbella sp. VKM Ac-2571]